MALTPEDVVNKRFNPTKFREGYDQDEVDDFLDEVVVELRRLNQENEELRQRLVAGEARINELQRGAAAAPVAAAEPAPVVAPEPAFAPAAVAAPEVNQLDPGNTNNLLQLARRLHEEHVREGMEKRDALIAEGHATAARVVSEAQQAQQAQLAGFEKQKQKLETEIDELRSFEKEYREKLRSYIEGQLQELESSHSLDSGSPSSGQVSIESAPVADASTEYVPAQQAAAPAGYSGPQSPDYGTYPQPTDYPGFAAGN
ncbi:DivIVA domain-containing protein [Lysinimonas soli]|uniref:Cell wall synthesis protein Wag31 n=1 Tax=Lysinimonas soli TaxID=1074233 RepID=A0ABW0NMD8_9MICO